MAKGLPDVIQKFGADNADYLRKLNENQDAVEQFAWKLGELQDKLIAAKRAQDDFASSGAIMRTADSVRAANERIVKLWDDGVEAQRRYGETLDQLASKSKVSADSIEKAAAQQRQLAIETKKYYDLLDTYAPKKAHDDLANAIANTGREVSLLGVKQGQVWADNNSAVVGTINSVRQLRREVSLLSEGGNFGGGGTAGALTALRGGGGDSGAAAAFLKDAFSGGGGGIFNTRDGGGGGGGILNAAAYANNIAAFVKQWAGAAHYAIMGIAEALSTIVPATVALGAATTVGYQAGQQLYTRGQALYTTAEALGPAYGTSFGQMIGLGGGLQQAQNTFGGGVYGVAGGLLNLAGMGQGKFYQMGGQTLQMMDQGMAALLVHAQQRNLQGTLGKVLGQGTQYLRQFGDIGANLGNFALGIAPDLPGVGGDILSSLVGITGAAGAGITNINRLPFGPALVGSALAGEAGWRLGTPMLGLAGKGLTGLGGLAGKLGFGVRGLSAAEAALSGGVVGEGGSGLAGMLGGIGAGLGGLTGLTVAPAAAIAFLMASQLSKPSAAQSLVAGLQGQVSQQMFSAQFQPLAHMLNITSGLAAQPPPDYVTAARTGGLLPGGPGGGLPLTTGQLMNARTWEANNRTFAAASQSAAAGLSNLATGMPQIQAALSKAGIHGASFGEAAQIASASLLDVTKAFRGGKLTAYGAQQIADYVRTVTGANIQGGVLQGGSPAGRAASLTAMADAQNILGSSQMQAVQKVNQAMDSITNIMTGAAVGPAALTALLGGSPVTQGASRAGIRLAAPPAFAAMAQALTSSLTPQGAAAWGTFAGPNGFVQTMQQNLDQYRIAQVLGAVQPGQAAGMSAFQLMQLLPMAQKSPAALSMLLQQGMQAGIPGLNYYQGTGTAKDQAANYAMAVGGVGKAALSPQQMQQSINQEAITLSRLPVMAASLIAPGTGGASALQNALMSQLGTAAVGLGTHLLAGGAVNKQALAPLTSVFAAGGVGAGKPMQVAVDAVLKNLNVPAGMVAKVDTILNPPKATKPPTMPPVQWKSVLAPPTAKPPTLPPVKWGSVMLPPTIPPPPKPPVVTIKYVNAPIPSPNLPPSPHPMISWTNKVPPAPAAPTVYGQIIYTVTVVGGSTSFSNPGNQSLPGGYPGGRGAQRGFRVPGYGGGDIFPAMLEPGETVLPKHATSDPLTKLLGAKYRVPGFAAGGTMPPAGASAAQLQAMINTDWKTLDALYAKKDVTKIDAYWQNVMDPLYAALDTALRGGTQSSTKAAQAAAARKKMGPPTAAGWVTDDPMALPMTWMSVAQLEKAGLVSTQFGNFLNATGMKGEEVPPNVAAYAAKGGKWPASMGSSFHMPGAGNPLYPAYNATSQLFPGANSHTVHVNVNGGAELDEATVKHVTERVQAALLRQARRNNKTGLQLRGKGV